MLAASYLPRRWPAKYCHRYESLRPCSGWERVVSSHLATSEFFEYAQNCIMIKANAISINYLIKMNNYSACQIKDLFARFTRNGGVAKPPLRNLLVLSFDKPTLLRRFVHLFLEKALVRLVMLG